MDNQYQAGVASLFSAIARVQRRYVYHKDWANNCWNVFVVINKQEDFIQSFTHLDDAVDFCNINNGFTSAQ